MSAAGTSSAAEANAGAKPNECNVFPESCEKTVAPRPPAVPVMPVIRPTLDCGKMFSVASTAVVVVRTD